MWGVVGLEFFSYLCGLKCFLMKIGVKDVLKEMSDKGLSGFVYQDVAANLLYMMTGDASFCQEAVYENVYKRKSKQNFKSVENIRMQGALIPLLREVLTKAMKLNPDMFGELLDVAPKVIGYESAEEIENKIQAKVLDNNSDVEFDELKKMVIKNIYAAQVKGDAKTHNDSIKLLFQYFNIENPDQTQKFIHINAKNNSVCPHCRREVRVESNLD